MTWKSYYHISHAYVPYVRYTLWNTLWLVALVKTLQAKDRVFKGPRSQKDQKSSQKTIAEEKKQ